MAREHYRWRVPGNSKPFSTKLEDWKNGDEEKNSQRSIGILEYLQEFGKVETSRYENEIRDYLEENYNHDRNQSNVKDWYRILAFMGLINYEGDCISLSIDGQNFLKKMHEKNYDEALDLYLKMLLRTSYPTPVATDIYLSLFPFRIIFKMLLEGPIQKSWFKTKIPYIKNYDDLKDIDNINRASYPKWQEWVLSFLKIWEIIEYEGDYVKLLDYKKEFFESAIGNMSYESMFFDSDDDYDHLKNLVQI